MYNVRRFLGASSDRAGLKMLFRIKGWPHFLVKSQNGECGGGAKEFENRKVEEITSR